MVKLSTLSPNKLLECNGQVITAEKAIEMVQENKELKLHLITDTFLNTILEKAYDAHMQGIEIGMLSALNDGEEVIVDIYNNNDLNKMRGK